METPKVEKSSLLIDNVVNILSSVQINAAIINESVVIEDAAASQHKIIDSKFSASLGVNPRLSNEEADSGE